MAFGDIRGTKTGTLTSITASFACSTGTNFAVVVGDLIVTACAEQSAKTVTACADNLGNTYTAIGAGADAGTVTGRAFYSRVTNPGTISSVTFTATASANNCVGLAVGFEGPFAVSPLDAAPTAIINDNTTPYTCPATGVLAQADEKIVNLIVHNANPTLTATSPNAIAVQLNTATVLRAALGHQTVTSTASVAPAWTSSGTPTTSGYGTASFKKDLSTADAWSVYDKSATITLTNSDKTATLASSAVASVRSSTARLNGAAGKYYAEIALHQTAMNCGLKDSTSALTTSNSAFFLDSSTGDFRINNAIVANIGVFAANDVFCIAWDSATERVWIRRNGGLWNNSGTANPATATGGLDGSIAAANNHALWFSSFDAADSATIRTETADLTVGNYPSGFTTWMAEALPESDAWSSYDKSADMTLSAGDKTATTTQSIAIGVRSTQKRLNGAAGKYYAEFLVTQTSLNLGVGIQDASATITSPVGAVCVIGGTTNNIFVNNASSGSGIGGGAIVAGNVVCMAWDAGAELVWFRRNAGLWNNNASANPATGVGGVNASVQANVDHALWFKGNNVGDSTTVRTENAELTVGSYPSGYTSWMGEALTLPTITGTMAAPEAPDVASATGLVGLLGTMAAPETADGAAFTGTVAAGGDPAFRSLSSTSYASTTNTTLTVPTGTADNDILFARIIALKAASGPTISPPAGWAQIGSTVHIADASNNWLTVCTYWKRAASESGSYVFTVDGGTARSQQGQVSAYSGCVTTGSPVHKFSEASGTNTTTDTTAGGASVSAIAPAITTTQAGCLLVNCVTAWDATARSPTSSWTERLDIEHLYLQDRLQTSAGATGSITVTANTDANPWTTTLIALLPAGAVGEPLPGLVQKNGGSVSANANLVTSLPGGTTAGNSILIFANGAGTITTPSGFVSRSPEIHAAGVYLFEKLVASGNASDTPTLVMSGPYNATWQIAEYRYLTAYDTSASNYGGSQLNGPWGTPSISPAAGNKRIVAFIASTMPVGSVPTSGDPQFWSGGFTGQQSNQVAWGGGTGEDPMVGGFADLLIPAGIVSTSAQITNANGTNHIPTAIIAAYTTTESPPAAESPSPLYRSQGSTSYASRTNTVISAPGILDDSIMLLGLFMGGAGGPPTPTLPTGFTLIDSTDVNDASNFHGVLRVAWKRAASESGSYTVTHATASTQAALLEYTGAITTGSPVDAYSKGSGSAANGTHSTTATAPSITTTVDNTTLVFFSHDWEGVGNLVPPSGMTERYDSLVYEADQEWPVAGATGTRAHTVQQGTANPWAAFLIALKPVEGGAPADITGTLGATEAGDSASASGTVRWLATLATTEAADTANIAAAVRWAATLAVTESTDVASATGLVRWSATLAATEAADIAAATGTVRWLATLATTESADVASAAGTVRWQATLAATEAADAVAIDGGIIATGTLATIEPGDTLAATGQVLSGLGGSLIVTEGADVAALAGQVTGVAGTLAATEATDTASGTGLVRWQATLATTETPDSASLTGTARWLATLGAVETADAVNISGGIVGTGTLAVSEAADSFAATGSVLSAGSAYLLVIEPPDAAAFTAQVTGVAGILATGEVPDTANASGQVRWAATLATIEPGDAASASGTVRWQAVLAATEAADSANVSGGIVATGTLGAAEAPDSFAATGLVLSSAGAILAATEPPDAVLLSGAVTGFVGALAASEVPDAAAIAAQVRWLATLAATEPGDAANATGLVRWLTALDATEAPDHVAIAGVLVTSGALAASEAPDTLAFTGAVRVDGTLAASEAIDTCLFWARVVAGNELLVTEPPDIVRFNSGVPITVHGFIAQDAPIPEVSGEREVLDVTGNQMSDLTIIAQRTAAASWEAQR